MTRPYEAIAIDLDGTLLEKGGVLADETIEIAQQLSKSGVAVTLVSGRMCASVKPFWQKLGLATPMTGYNGAMILDSFGCMVSHKPVDLDVSRHVIDICEKAHIHLNVYIDDILHVAEPGGLGQWYSDYYKAPLKVEGKLSEWISQPCTKLLAIAENEAALPPLQAMLEKELAGQQVRFTTSSGRYVEVLNPAVSKGRALASLSEFLEIPLSRWVAFGDDFNDLEMLTTAGCGVAVENSRVCAAFAGETAPPSASGLREISKRFFGL